MKNRVRFLPTLPHHEYLSLVQEADVVLDTLHFNGQNTSLEAFAMGIPVVTFPGTMQRERHTFGMYLEMQFMDLVADSEARYVEIAVRVANDHDFRDACCARISESASKLFERIDFVRNCEAVLNGLVETARRVRSAKAQPDTR